MRTIKSCNEEGFIYLKTIRKGTKEKTGKFLVECPRCHENIIVCANSYYRNRIRCKCEVYHKRLYSIYTDMKTRCYNSRSNGYSDYGGRGILICDEWRNDFHSFYDWAISHGYLDNLSIDRIDVNGNYEPSNCKWSTAKEQVRNRRNTLLFECGTEKKTLKEICDLFGLNYKTEHTRLSRHGFDAEQQYLNKLLELEGGIDDTV